MKVISSVVMCVMVASCMAGCNSVTKDGGDSTTVTKVSGETRTTASSAARSETLGGPKLSLFASPSRTTSPKSASAPSGLTETELVKAPSVYKETLTKLSVSDKAPEVRWSSDGADLAILPNTQGPIDTYRPLYKIDSSKKVSGKGEGFTEREAALNAIYNVCQAEKCDFLAASKELVRTFEKNKKLAFEVTVIGFPATLTGVQTIKATFYEQLANGELKPMDNPEHRYVLTKDNGWKAAVFSGTPGTSVKSSLDAKNMDVTPTGKGEGSVENVQKKVEKSGDSVVNTQSRATTKTAPANMPYKLK